MNRYFSSKNRFTTWILWGLVVGMSVLLVNAYRENNLSWPAGIVMGLVTLFILWVLLDTRYVLRNNILLYRSGPIRGRIAVDHIRKIRKHSGLFVPVTLKPALDVKGFIITYNQFDDIFVSPKNADAFLDELVKINPEIEVNC
ncbi:MAG: hypothetical protein RL607_911 [Bacteroidota bacterium]|jgi:hypothetical protein